jgi:hypothetical protein
MADTRKQHDDDGALEEQDDPDSGVEDIREEDDDDHPVAEDQDEANGPVEPPRRGIDVTQSALVSVCWSHGGTKLDGLLIVRRTDGHSVLLQLPMDIEKHLDTLDRHAIVRHSGWLLEIAITWIGFCDFQPSDWLPDDYLLEGDCPATIGTMRHITPRAADAHGRRSWRDTMYLVDVGDVELDYWRATSVH